MLFQAKIHERENEGCDGRAGLGAGRGSSGEAGAGREGLLSSWLTHTPLCVRWAPGASGLCEPAARSCVLAARGRALLPSSLCLPFPQDVSPCSNNSSPNERDCRKEA